MAHKILMSALLTRARKRADKVGDDSLTDPDLQALISEVYGKLYTLVAESGHRYFEASTPIPSTGATSYTIPVDHLGTVRVERVLDAAGRCAPLREISIQEQTYWRGLTGSAVKFAIGADQIYPMPTPPVGDTYKVWYIPQPPDLTTYLTTDLVDLVTPAGERYLINAAALLAKGQTDGDVRLLMSERDEAAADLLEWATLRAFSQSPRPFVDDGDSGYSDNPASYYLNPPR